MHPTSRVGLYKPTVVRGSLRHPACRSSQLPSPCLYKLGSLCSCGMKPPLAVEHDLGHRHQHIFRRAVGSQVAGRSPDRRGGVGRKPFRSSRSSRRSSPALDPLDELYPLDNSLEYPSPAGPFSRWVALAQRRSWERPTCSMAASDCPPSRLLTGGIDRGDARNNEPPVPPRR